MGLRRNFIQPMLGPTTNPTRSWRGTPLSRLQQFAACDFRGTTRARPRDLCRIGLGGKNDPTLSGLPEDWNFAHGVTERRVQSCFKAAWMVLAASGPTELISP